MVPGLVGLKVGSLVCTRSGPGRTRSMISWSLGLGDLAGREGTMTTGLGLEVRGPSTSSIAPLPLSIGLTCTGLKSFSSRLSSNESIVSSKNWRHSCSSRLRNCSASSCQSQETVGNYLADMILFNYFFIIFSNFDSVHTAILLLSWDCLSFPNSQWASFHQHGTGFSFAPQRRPSRSKPVDDWLFCE